MGNDPIGDEFDLKAVGAEITAILNKSTVNITDEARANLTDIIQKVGDRVASAAESASLFNDLSVLNKACCVISPDDKVVVQKYLNHLEM